VYFYSNRENNYLIQFAEHILNSGTSSIAFSNMVKPDFFLISRIILVNNSLIRKVSGIDKKLSAYADLFKQQLFCMPYIRVIKTKNNNFEYRGHQQT